MIKTLPRRAVNYFLEVKSEIEKVAWPTQKTVLLYSAFVIGICVILAVYFGFADFGLTKLLDFLVLSR